VRVRTESTSIVRRRIEPSKIEQSKIERSKMKRPVLILGSVPRITIPIARSLHAHDVPVEVASFSAVEPPPWSRAVADFNRLPLSTEDDQSTALLESLTRLISKRGYDMLIPANDTALAFISQHDARLRESLYVACPPARVVERILNKSLTLEVAHGAGIPTPSTYRISNSGELEALSSQLRFPLVAKPCDKSDEMDFKVRYFQTYESLHQALAADKELGGKLLLQEFAQGDGVGIEVLIHHGEAVAIFQHRRLKEFPASGGVAAVALAEPLEPILVDQALALLRALEWDGVAMVEFRYDRARHQSSLLEVNGRYWGTLALPIQAGLDFPWYEWQLAHGEKPDVSVNYSAGARWRWSAGYLSRWHDLARDSVRNQFQHRADIAEFGSKQSEVKEFGLRELIPSFADLSARDALWDTADPMPAIGELLRTVKDLAASDVKGIMRKLSPDRHRSRS
jgi:predicted ATP-grasp superfamily ATP-dependent carboligase